MNRFILLFALLISTLAVNAQTSVKGPSASLNTSGFSTAADSSGKYSPGTTFNIAPVVSQNAEVCNRSGSWSGLSAAPFNTSSQVTLSNPGSVYSFGLKCYNDGGSGSAVPVTVQTNTGVAPPTPVPGGDCTTPYPAPAEGFALSPSFARFPDLRKPGSSQPMGDFPNNGGQGQLALKRGQYGSLRFFVPVNNGSNYAGLVKRFSWLEGQLTGGEANLNKTYITVSQCRGDFRVPASSAAAPANDTTLAQGCRNLRYPVGTALRNISYNVTSTFTPSTNFVCNLKSGQWYYLNVIIANPLDGGITPGEMNCLGGDNPQCGIQLQVN